MRTGKALFQAAARLGKRAAIERDRLEMEAIGAQVLATGVYPVDPGDIGRRMARDFESRFWTKFAPEEPEGNDG